jgi:restriction system protein
MPVPGFQSFLRPLLVYAQDGMERKIGDAIKALADEFKLSERDRAEMLPSGKQTLLANRVHWARTFLAKAGALKNTKRAHFEITERGKMLLDQNPHSINVKTLNQFPEFVAFQSPKPTDANQEAITYQSSAGTPNEAATPDDAIDASEKLLIEKLKSDLLEKIVALSPAFFETLVVDLIVAMKYGGGSHESVRKRLKNTGDGGIDGVVNEDVLGLDAVYIQAKRYSPDNTVGRPLIQQFAGALAGEGANKGVFITTSSFSSGTHQFAVQVPQKIVLIDGRRLGELMIQYDVGVRIERTVHIKKIDLDYFEEDEG